MGNFGIMNTDSITLTGDNAEQIEGEVKDEVRITIVGRITRKSVHEPYNLPATSESDKKPAKAKEVSEVTISDLTVEECCMNEDEEEEDELMEGEEGSGIPKAVRTITKG